MVGAQRQSVLVNNVLFYFFVGAFLSLVPSFFFYYLMCLTTCHQSLQMSVKFEIGFSFSIAKYLRANELVCHGAMDWAVMTYIPCLCV